MKKAMVYGLGTSGTSAVKLLKVNNYEVIEVDDKNAINSKEALNYLDGVSLFIKSPGIPYNDLINRVMDLGIELIDEIELAYRFDRTGSKIIAVTGTNGKTTTTSKIAGLLELSGFQVEAGGNIGKAYSEIVLNNEKLDYLVLELSSYQLENLKTFKPDIAIIINLAPDHLDRYKNLEDYYKAKLNILNNQENKDFFIVNLDSQELQNFKLEYKQSLLKVSSNFCENADIYVENGIIKGYGNDDIETVKFSLKGKHNLENILFILAVSKILNLDYEIVKKYIYTTEALEHRMELVLEKNDIIFINDSKGTNIDSTIKAINAYEKKVVLICGGKDKKLDLTPLVEAIIEKVKKVYLIGETADKLEILLKRNSYKHAYNFGNLEEVIINLEIETGDVVLFSPAHSSFDQYKNYMDRGKVFKELVKNRFN